MEDRLTLFDTDSYKIRQTIKLVTASLSNLSVEARRIL